MNGLLNQIWKLEKKGLSAGEVLVLVSIADAANVDGLCWPKVDTLAAKTGMAEGSIRRMIVNLTKAGFLAVEHRHSNGRQRSNVYRLLLPADASTGAHPARLEGDSGAHPARLSGAHPARLHMDEPQILNPQTVSHAAAVRPSNSNAAKASSSTSSSENARIVEEVEEVEEDGRRMIEAEIPCLRGKVYPTADGRATITALLQAGHTREECKMLWERNLKHRIWQKDGQTYVGDKYAFPSFQQARLWLTACAAEAGDRTASSSGGSMTQREAEKQLGKYCEKHDLSFAEVMQSCVRKWGEKEGWGDKVREKICFCLHYDDCLPEPEVDVPVGAGSR